MINFRKHSILNIWHGSEYTSGLLKLFWRRSQRNSRDCLIYAKLIIVFTPNLAFFPYSEVIHGSTTFKLTKRYQSLKQNDNFSTWCFWSFFHFLHYNVPGNKCYKQKLSVLFFYTHQSVCGNLHKVYIKSTAHDSLHMTTTVTLGQ